MGDDKGYDDKKQRARAGRGLTSSDRAGSPSRHHQSTQPERSPQSRHFSPNRDEDRNRPSSSNNNNNSNTRRVEDEKNDLIPRFRSQPRNTEPRSDRRNRRGHSRDRERGRGRDRDRTRQGSPSPYAKRNQSRSPSYSTSRRKKAKKQSSPSRRRRDYHDDPSKPGRRRSPHRGNRQEARRHAPASPHGQTTSRSPHRGYQPGSRSPRTSHFEQGDSGHFEPDQHRRLSKNSLTGDDYSHNTSSHDPFLARHSGTIPGEDSSFPDQQRYPDFHEKISRSPRQRDEIGQDYSIDQQSTARPHLDDMPSRGSRRGARQPPSNIPLRNNQHQSNLRRFSRSSIPLEPSGPTSPSHSPHGSGPGRASRTGQQFSPSQHPPSNGYQAGNDLNYGDSSQTSGRFGQRDDGFHTGYRRGPGFKSSRWYSGNQAGTSGHDSHLTNEAEPHGQDSKDTHHNTAADSRKLTTDEAVTTTKNEGPPRGPSGRPPPTGPSSSKFSFAFKSSKPAPTGPKPEISQKFQAGPQRKDKSQSNQAPPRSAPTEPASSRSRYDARNAPERPRAEAPRHTPRMRKVKKIMRRPKFRPTLPVNLVHSESVFFRKPGNESVIGSGTYGKVFKGLNVYTKGLVAMKKIRMEGERDGFPVTAMREIKLLQSLRHTNIVNLQEVMVEKNDCFMVFEYLSYDLTGLLNHPTFKLECAQRKHLAQQMFQGLEYLHDRGVLHRDIKAANILVSKEGILKIADFGLARFYAKHHQLDYTNRVITVWYRSPELLLGETQYTAAVDVWSAACVMVEIFNRLAIFPGDGTELSQLEKISNILGTPNLKEWPGFIDMPWFELLRPTARKKNLFAEKYGSRLTPAAFELLASMFQYDPAKRPTATEVLQHAFFTTEEPRPKQAVELATIDGDWHEFESKALRKENERKEREARKAKALAKDDETDRKRPVDGSADQTTRSSKRVHVDAALLD